MDEIFDFVLIRRWYLVLLVLLVVLSSCNKNNNQIVELEGRYVQGKYANTKFWGTDCYLIESNGTSHSVSCISPKAGTTNMSNITIRMRGVIIPPEKIPKDYMGQMPVGEEYFPGHIQILDYEILAEK